MQFELKYKKFGEKAILIEWPERIDENILNDILRFKQTLSESLKLSVDIIDVVSAYNSITILHKNNAVNFERRVEILNKIYQQSHSAKLEKSVIYTIPVCYEHAMAMDLDSFLEAKNISLDRLIELHTKPVYKVYFLGFLPGFMYLGGLTSELQWPRKATPDMNIPKGSVAIGGLQTGIYPQTSPGGWHVIGQSPLEFFDTNAENVCIAQAGDCIQFRSIDSDEFQSIRAEIDNGIYTLKSEPWNA